MTLDVNYNGVFLSNYCKIMEVERDIMPPRSLSTLSVGGKDGAYLFGKKVEPRFFTVEIMFIGDVVQEKRSLASVLDTDEPKPLEFSDEPNRTYYAIVSDDTDIDHILNVGRGEITFVALDPYAYGQEHLQSYQNVTSISDTLAVNGQVETFPTIRVEFKEKSEFFAIGAGDELSTKTLMVGQSPDTEEETVEYEELVFYDDLSTTTGWSKVTSSNLDGGTAQMDMASDGSRFYVPDYGSGDRWHGAAVKRALPEPLQDFLIQAKVTQRSTGTSAANQVGRVEVYLLDANDNTVGKLIMRCSDPYNYTNYGFARLGQGSNSHYMIKRKDRRFNYFKEGVLRMRRVGNRFSAYIARIDPETGRSTFTVSRYYTDIDEHHLAEVTQVMINISAFGTHPPTTQFADEVKVWKVNDYDAEEAVPEIFEEGDVLEIDMARNRVLKNGMPFMEYLNPTSEFFGLKAGDNALAISSGGLADVQISYKSRWY